MTIGSAQVEAHDLLVHVIAIVVVDATRDAEAVEWRHVVPHGVVVRIRDPHLRQASRSEVAEVEILRLRNIESRLARDRCLSRHPRSTTPVLNIQSNRRKRLRETADVTESGIHRNHRVNHLILCIRVLASCGAIPERRQNILRKNIVVPERAVELVRTDIKTTNLSTGRARVAINVGCDAGDVEPTVVGQGANDVRNDMEVLRTRRRVDEVGRDVAGNRI